MAISISDAMLDELIGDAKTQDDLFGNGGILKELSKRLMERILEAEMTHQLGSHLTQQFLTEIQKCIYFALSVFKDKSNENRFFRYLQ